MKLRKTPTSPAGRVRRRDRRRLQEPAARRRESPVDAGNRVRRRGPSMDARRAQAQITRWRRAQAGSPGRGGIRGGRIGREPGRRIGLANGSAAIPRGKPRQCSSRANPPLRARRTARRGGDGRSVAAFAGGAVRRPAQSNPFQPPHGRMRGRDRRIASGRSATRRGRAAGRSRAVKGWRGGSRPGRRRRACVIHRPRTTPRRWQVQAPIRQSSAWRESCQHSELKIDGTFDAIGILHGFVSFDSAFLPGV